MFNKITKNTHNDKYSFTFYYFSSTGNKDALSVDIFKKEYERFLREKTFPITDEDGFCISVNDDGFLHSLNGRAFCSKGKEKSKDNSSGYYSGYYINGIGYPYNDWMEEKRKILKRFYFLRKKIICLKKLLEIPEMWDEVYYSHKNEFLSLMKRI